MVKVIILRAFHTVEGEPERKVERLPGQVVTTTEENAALWIEHGHAKRVEPTTNATA